MRWGLRGKVWEWDGRACGHSTTIGDHGGEGYGTMTMGPWRGGLWDHDYGTMEGRAMGP